MKKLIISLLGIMIILTGCTTSSKSDDSDPTAATTTYDSDNKIALDTTVAQMISITYDQLVAKMDSDDNFILYIGRTDCPDCQEFGPLLTDYLADNPGMYVYYFNIKEFRDAAISDDATQSDKDNYNNLQTYLDFKWTPTLKHVVAGQFVASYQYLSEAYYDLDSSSEKESQKKEFISVFKKWLEESFEAA